MIASFHELFHHSLKSTLSPAQIMGHIICHLDVSEKLAASDARPSVLLRVDTTSINDHESPVEFGDWLSDPKALESYDLL